MKIVSITPAGRKKYLEILFPYLLSNRHIIDEHHFWINTDNEEDVKSIYEICNTYPKFFKAIEPNFPPPRTPQKINQFYWKYRGKKELYLRFDDDICWMNKTCIKDLIDFRVQNRKYFLVYGNTINHTTCNRLHQEKGCCPKDIEFYFKGEHASLIHQKFFENLKNEQLENYYFEPYENTTKERISTNCISWFGEDLDEEMLINEEQFLAVDFPSVNKKINCIFGKCLTVHFAYAPQRDYLEKETNYLIEYKKLLNRISFPRIIL